MGKLLSIFLLWLMLVVCVARPEIPATIHNVIEHWRWSKYQPPVPVPLPNIKVEPQRQPVNGKVIEC